MEGYQRAVTRSLYMVAFVRPLRSDVDAFRNEAYLLEHSPVNCLIRPSVRHSTAVDGGNYGGR